MGRKRKHDRDLPERVYRRGAQYIYLPLGKTKYVKLGATKAEALQAYAKLLQGVAEREPSTIGDCMDDYLRSAMFARLAPRTQKDYQRDLLGLRKYCGHMRPADLIPPHVYKYMSKRGPVRARLEVAVLKNVCDIAIMAGLIDSNPCLNLRYEPAPRRMRMPSPAEIAAFCKHAGPQVTLYCRLKLATGLRMGDMLRLDRRMIGPKGLTVTPAKTATRTGKVQVFMFLDAEGQSTGLRELLDEILALRRRVTALALFATRSGQHYTVDGWKSIWQRSMVAYVAAGGERFREHDIRATAGASKEDRDGREQARKLLGHELESTTAGYTGRRKVVKITPNK